MLLAPVAVGALVGCSSSTRTAREPAALTELLATTRGWPDLGGDTIEVWVCAVPVGTTDPTYDPAPVRLTLTPAALATTLDARVGPYFAALSHGQYRPVFVPGGAVAMSADDSPTDCVDDALRRSQATSNAVLAVADAEHTATAPGGFGIAGTACTTARATCSAAATGRAAYVGGSDFDPHWGDAPPVDLVEHELGHLLGWPHSGAADGGGHDSALDVMSNSAAPRELDPARRDAQDTLAVNRLAARWLPLDSAAVAVAGAPATYSLSPSFGLTGTRVIILPVDDHRMLTVELLGATGLDALLPASGIAVHLVDLSAGCASSPASDAGSCTTGTRIQTTEVGTAPFLDLLAALGASWSGEGWRVEVVSVVASPDALATVLVSATG